MAEIEYQTPCIKPITTLCENEDVENFWFDAPLRFGLWAFLKNKLPEKVSQFSSSESFESGNPEPLEITESKTEQSILVTDENSLPDKFGVVVYNPITETTFETEDEAKHTTTVLIRVFAPKKANLDKYDVVNLNIIGTVVKRLLYNFSTEDVWKFEGVSKEVFENLRLTRIRSTFSDSGGAGVRLERAVNDITLTFTYDENLENLENFGE